MDSSTKTENENCLAGMKCSQCGALEPFEIEVKMLVTVTDDGTEDGGDTSWDDVSFCRCKTCNHSGVVWDFRVGILTEDDLVSIGYRFSDDPDTAGHTYFESPLGEGSESFYNKADAIRAAAANAAATYQLSRCDNCGKVHTKDTIVKARNLHIRTEPGEIIPSGECTECGALCYPIE